MLCRFRQPQIMGLLPLVLLTSVDLAGLPGQTITPQAPVRFLVPEDSLVHVSLQREYSRQPANLEVVEIQRDGEGHSWVEEIHSYTPEDTQTHPGVTAFRSGLARKGHQYEARVTGKGRLSIQFFPMISKSSGPEAVKAGMS